jgi:hypothetical protein
VLERALRVQVPLRASQGDFPWTSRSFLSEKMKSSARSRPCSSTGRSRAVADGWFFNEGLDPKLVVRAEIGRYGVDYDRTEKGVTTTGSVTDEASINELLAWARAHEKGKDR